MSDHRLIYITIHGIPLSFRLEWPFVASQSGADFHVLHGEAQLEDGSGRHALFSMQMTVSVKEALPSLEPKDTLAPVINAVRKSVDTKYMELIKSPKRQPIALSSRFFSILAGEWTFHRASEEQLAIFLKQRTYWLDKLGVTQSPIADPVDVQYLAATPEQFQAAARRLEQLGLLQVASGQASATAKLRQQGSEIEAAATAAVAELEAKHAFERG
jgi:hypothetical protein